MTGIENFLGKWMFIPERAAYEFGPPPKSGTYEILQDGQTLMFNIAWVDDKGEAQAVSYAEVCDGEFHDYPVKQAADEICLSLKHAALLESEARKGGRVVLSAKRELVSEDEMKVTMSGDRPDGSPYRNVSWYVRI
ncbi:MAG TPA: hypothetical protein VJ965_10460 [Anaerolineales bacterium]|nr:hypothetical protein [Anaerolineales bacterium]